MRVYVLEDEENIRNYILSILKEIPEIVVVGYADQVQTALVEIPKLEPHLILADIRLKDTISFRLFDTLDIEKYKVIFITAFSHYSIQALNLGAIGYLLKPIADDELKAAIQKVIAKNEAYLVHQSQLQLANSYIEKPKAVEKLVLKNRDYLQIIRCDDIVYCEGDKGYTTFFLNNEPGVLVSKVLKEYEALLSTTNFIRCHQSYLVNMNYVTRYFKEGYLQLRTGVKIPVSTRKKDDVLRYLEQLL
ncbi:LytR/AlgR family response regulator transcription factor [Elizabethkingia anophelis]|uniref:LytR/AlgR family response regulator transcription factor n=1 Tax=Elizabethkingia anophelis TaxID=1117645 RepID=UPI0004E3C4E7|nr:LytTR family DNA-binding domain-containing protein [Elizabethkingia anophelis]AKH94116.1 response regulator [Elizabethkingia anophelis FMS-007]KFC34513.1 response regulator [Elizabethkingia anophelis]MCL1033508.1 LytTR family DNA-binding domain-containing protein [Elizabethkingia anophelis]MCT3697877.1 response regulator transcription factor [Elizabethkingia anophelis]MCT3733196.1 response regulator transcription factor [Elizabethkingia anophelis]